MPLSPVDRFLGITFEQPELTGLNRVPMRATQYSFPTAEAAKTQTRDESPWWQSLDGTWRFLYRESPYDLPEGIESADTSAEGWADIPVPSNWPLHGYSFPHYTNVKMPFAGEPPFTPERNPTGVYSRHFTVPADWKGRRIVLHFGGVDGVLQLYINGEFVGLNKDSRLPSEFDVTERVNFDGENLITAVVIQYSDATFVEDQDQWRLGGMHREVYLYATESIYIEDIFARTDFDAEKGLGHLDLAVRVTMGQNPEEGWNVVWELLDDSGKAITESPVTTPVDAKYFYHAHWPRVGAHVKQDFANIQPWSAELPQRYQLVVSLCKPDGAVVEASSVWIGFRRVEIKNREMLINGKAVLIKGVNRHDHSETEGNVVSEALMRKDLEVMKAFNVNAVRTSHYPNDPLFYDLCDEYGFYVIDEANIESHAYHNQICDDPRYLDAFVERGMRMVMRDKNHPCIIMWSLGNESGHGANHDAMAGFIRKFDPSRLVHYEGAISRGQSHVEWDMGHLATDIICPMYPQIQEMIDWVESSDDPRPMILCEYSHAMGNSNGCLREYFEAFESYHGLQGGFIWEWVDHGLAETSEDGQKYWTYGGDYGDSPNDANFIADGLVWPDRTPHPALYEFKKLAQPLAVTLKSESPCTITVRSKQDFRALDYLQGTWTLRGDGKTLASGSFALDAIAPGANEDIVLADVANAADAFDGEHLALKVSFALKSTEGLLPAGHELAWEQLVLKETALRKVDSVPAASSKPEVSEKAITLQSDALTAIFCKKTGELSVLSAAGSENVLASSLHFTWWRAATDNDGIKLWDGQDNKPLGKWKNAGVPNTTIALKSQETTETSVVATWQISTPVHADAGTYTQTCQLTAEGLLVSNELNVSPDMPDLARVGTELALVPGFEQVSYRGFGPYENYRDRDAGVWQDIFETTATDMYVPYIMPQENGGRSGVSWCAFSNGKTTLHVEALGAPLEFKATHFNDADWFAATHTYELKPRPETWVSLDHLQRGLGTMSCGPDTLDKYKIQDGQYAWSILIRIDS